MPKRTTSLKPALTRTKPQQKPALRLPPDLSREELNALKSAGPQLPEARHFHVCAECGQAVDRRNLGDVFHHETAGHTRILASDGALPRLGQPLRFMEPMQATLATDAPEGDNWLHELKYDGYRTQIVLDWSAHYAFTRRGFDWSELYDDLLQEARYLDCTSAILDGEVIVQDPNGLSDFHKLQKELRSGKPEGLVFMAFDLLHLNGKDLRGERLEDRRARLVELLGDNDPERPIHFSSHVVGGGPEFFLAAEQMGLEGIVSKKLGSRYRSGPSKSWLKVKAFTESEFVVIGTSRGDKAPVALLARETENGLSYSGAAMVTLPGAEREIFWRTNEELKTPNPAVPMEPRKETSWLRPEMKVRVRHLQGEEMLRHATIQAMTQLPTQRPGRAPPKAEGAEPTYVKPAIDADALRAYYAAIAPLMLPWIAERPLNLFRCPGRDCFFQRNRNHPPAGDIFKAPIQSLPVQQKNGKVEDYLFVTDASGIFAAVEAHVVEFHSWGSRVHDIERPDRIVFDLDPDEGLPFKLVREGADQVRRSLEALGLESFAMLTGGKGIHVVLPFEAEREWPQVRAFAKQFCDALASADPARFTTSLPKAQRKGRIFLDYLRNQRTATAIMPYSARARAGLPVAAPIGWAELDSFDTAAAFNIADAQGLIRRAKSAGLRGWGRADQQLPALG